MHKIYTVHSLSLVHCLFLSKTTKYDTVVLLLDTRDEYNPANFVRIYYMYLAVVAYLSGF
jgi:hypothetical protein